MAKPRSRAAMVCALQLAAAALPILTCAEPATDGVGSMLPFSERQTLLGGPNTRRITKVLILPAVLGVLAVGAALGAAEDWGTYVAVHGYTRRAIGPGISQ